jgi:guanylate kinase
MLEYPSIAKAITHTTRSPRGSEQNGRDYYFLQTDVFQGLIAEGQFLEYAKVFGNYYGTSKQEVERLASLGKTIILEVDVQGWKSVKALAPQAVGVFIFPPSIASLWERLETRGTDDLETRRQRLRTARDEIDASKDFDFFIINEQVDRAYQDLVNIIALRETPPLDKKAGMAHRQALLEEFSRSQGPGKGPY